MTTNTTIFNQTDHIKRVRGGKSYVLIDNRASGGGLIEMAALTCSHCNTIVVLHPQRTRERNHCRKCNSYVCDKAGCILECNPTEQMVELAFKYPDQPWLLRGDNGETLFDPALKERQKVY